MGFKTIAVYGTDFAPTKKAELVKPPSSSSGSTAKKPASSSRSATSRQK